MTTIGVVGLGAMGGRIAGRLLAHGHTVHGFNRTRAKADTLIQQGLRWSENPRTTGNRCDIVISMVTDGDALDTVTRGTDGILAGLRPGSIYIDMSTVSPQTSRNLAERVTSRGAAMLSAPVSGSVHAVEEGSKAWFDVAMMQKDLRLALDQGREEGVPMPSTTVADEMLSAARAAGYEHRDIAAVFRMLSDMVVAPPGRTLESVTA